MQRSPSFKRLRPTFLRRFDLCLTSCLVLRFIGIQNERLKEPDTFDDRISLDVLVHGVNVEPRVGQQVAKAVDVARQRPVALGVGVSKRKGGQNRLTSPALCAVCSPDAQSRCHDDLLAAGNTRLPGALDRPGQQVPSGR